MVDPPRRQEPGPAARLLSCAPLVVLSEPLVLNEALVILSEAKNLSVPTATDRRARKATIRIPTTRKREGETTDAVSPALWHVRTRYLRAAKYWLNGFSIGSFSNFAKPASSATLRIFAGPMHAP